MLGAAATAAALVLTSHHDRGAVGAAGTAAVLILGAAVASPLPSLVPWPLAILAGAYAWELGGGGLDQWAPLYAGALLAVAELAYWSTELRGRAHDAAQLTERRAAVIAALALGAIAVGALVLAATALPVGSGVVTDALGAAAAVAACAVVAAVARARS